MDDLFLFLSLLSGILLLIGVINPAAFWPILKLKLSRPKVALIFSLSGIISFICFGLTTDLSTTNDKSLSNGSGIGISKDSIMNLVTAIDAGFEFSDNLDSDTTVGISDNNSVIMLGSRHNPREIIVFSLVGENDVQTSRSFLLIGTLAYLIDTNTGYWSGEFFDNFAPNETVRDSIFLGGKKYKMVSAMGAPVRNITLSITPDIRNR